jgi:uncharacterized protein (DUF302 family)
MRQPAYALTVDVDLPPAAAEERVTALLKEQGFGVLSRIDVAATLRAKIGEEIGDYVILGACNPGFAHRAIQAVPSIGILLPCNVVVAARDGGSRVHLTRVEGVFTLVDADGMDEVAAEVGRRMEAVAAGLRG